MANLPRSCTSSKSLLHNLDLPRVILLMDVDCYEVQVWAKRENIDYKNVPIIVVNHLDMMLSINYVARALGIPKTNETINVDELQVTYPELRILRAELNHGLTDTLLLTKESDQILDAVHSHPLFQKGKAVVERANNDEIYIDCTVAVQEIILQNLSSEPHKHTWPNLVHRWKEFESCTSTANWDEPTLVLEGFIPISGLKQHLEDMMDFLQRYHGNTWRDHINNSMLIYGSQLARTLHLSIWKNTGYSVSFGISSNKMLAKIACEKNKPNAITMLNNWGRQRLFKTLEFRKLPGFKSETGEELQDLAYQTFDLDLVTLEDVSKCPVRILDDLFDRIRKRKPNLKEGTDSLRLKLDGKCDEPVIAKFCNDSIRKSLPLYGVNSIHSWEELLERIEDLAVVFHDKLKYHFQRYTEMPAAISVKTQVKRGGMRATGNVGNTLEVLSSLPTQGELQDFIEEYVQSSHGNYYQHVKRIWLIASNFGTPSDRPYH